MKQDKKADDPFPWVNNNTYEFQDWEPPAEFRGSTFAKRRQFFEQNPKYRNGNYVCPSCGYPTLEYRNIYSFCSLCMWEDDGQDDPWGDYKSGPNGTTLNQSRRNFSETMTSYSAKQLDDMEPGFKQRVLQQRERTILICTSMDRLMKARTESEINEIWLNIGKTQMK